MPFTYCLHDISMNTFMQLSRSFSYRTPFPPLLCLSLLPSLLSPFLLPIFGSSSHMLTFPVIFSLSFSPSMFPCFFAFSLELLYNLLVYLLFYLLSYLSTPFMHISSIYDSESITLLFRAPSLFPGWFFLLPFILTFTRVSSWLTWLLLFSRSLFSVFYVMLNHLFTPYFLLILTWN